MVSVFLGLAGTVSLFAFFSRTASYSYHRPSADLRQWAANASVRSSMRSKESWASWGRRTARSR